MLAKVDPRRNLSRLSARLCQQLRSAGNGRDIHSPDTEAGLPPLRVLYLPGQARRVHLEDDQQDLR